MEMNKNKNTQQRAPKKQKLLNLQHLIFKTKINYDRNTSSINKCDASTINKCYTTTFLVENLSQNTTSENDDYIFNLPFVDIYLSNISEKEKKNTTEFCEVSYPFVDEMMTKYNHSNVNKTHTFQ